MGKADSRMSVRECPVCVRALGRKMPLLHHALPLNKSLITCLAFFVIVSLSPSSFKSLLRDSSLCGKKGNDKASGSF